MTIRKLDLENKKCVVITPYTNRIEPPVEQGLRELERRGYAVWREYGISAIDFGRSLLATRALSEGFDETLWVDSDVAFCPDQVDALRSIAWTDLHLAIPDELVTLKETMRVLERQYACPGILCGLYVKKSATDFASGKPTIDKSITFGAGGKPTLISYAGAGMMLVRSWAYKLVQSAHSLPVCDTSNDYKVIPFFLPMVLLEADGRATYLCEDYAFCERARMAGIPLFADTRMRLFHFGSYGFSWEDLSSKVTRYQTYEMNTTNGVVE